MKPLQSLRCLCVIFITTISMDCFLLPFSFNRLYRLSHTDSRGDIIMLQHVLNDSDETIQAYIQTNITFLLDQTKSKFGPEYLFMYELRTIFVGEFMSTCLSGQDSWLGT
jgi:hypothetical protein